MNNPNENFILYLAGIRTQPEKVGRLNNIKVVTDIIKLLSDDDNIWSKDLYKELKHFQKSNPNNCEFEFLKSYNIRKVTDINMSVIEFMYKHKLGKYVIIPNTIDSRYAILYEDGVYYDYDPDLPDLVFAKDNVKELYVLMEEYSLKGQNASEFITIDKFEKQIKQVESFDIRINMSEDRKVLSYPYTTPAVSDITVDEFLSTRIFPHLLKSSILAKEVPYVDINRIDYTNIYWDM